MSYRMEKPILQYSEFNFTGFGIKISLDSDLNLTVLEFISY